MWGLRCSGAGEAAGPAAEGRVGVGGDVHCDAWGHAGHWVRVHRRCTLTLRRPEGEGAP